MSQISNSDRKPRIVVALTLVLLPLVYFFPAVLGKVTLAPGDGWTQILGIRVLIGQMLANGELPLWNPYIFAGMPLLASIQPGALYPPTWFFAVFSPQTAMNLLVLTTYHVALFGTYLFARRTGASRIGAVIAAVTFSLGGYMVAHLGHTNRINAAAWLPWILLAIEELHRQTRWRWVALGAIFIALQQFAGDPQMTAYSAMLAGAYTLFTLFFRTLPERRKRFVMLLWAMVVCGGLLSMIQVMPARELQRLGDRAGIDYDYFSQFSFPPSQIFELFFPYYFGGAALEPYRVSYWGKWNLAETCGYVGMVAWLLAFAAIFARKFLSPTKSREENTKTDSIGEKETALFIRFWAICAVVALLLAFGSYLPFGIYKLMHKVPLYNLFRASGRNFMEMNFALGMLAGLGATALTQFQQNIARRILLKSTVLLAAIVSAAVIVYRFFDERLVTETPLPTEAGQLTNPDLYVPLVFFCLSVFALLVYARRWHSLAGAALVMVLFLDLAAWGFSFEWRLIDDKTYNVAERLADSESVKFIKSRESDLNAFRTVSHSENPFKENSDLVNYPNISIARGLQSVNGYDPIRLGQMAEIAGRMTLDGYITESETLESGHQGLNLLNAKYLLAERADVADSLPKLLIEGVSFNDPPINLMLKPDSMAVIQGKGFATELAVISAMGNSDDLPDGAPVVGIILRTKDGRVIERELQAGRDTSEWAIDRADVRARTKHRRATIGESWDSGGFQGHRFLARLKFDRAEIASIEFRYLANEADITIARASLFDAETGASQPLDALPLPADRWRQVARYGAVGVYENLKVLPRAWFTRQAVVVPSVEVLSTIKTGKLNNGSAVNLRDTVLLESELFGKRQLKTPLANLSAADISKTAASEEVKVTSYKSNRIELQTNNASAGFLVLSEIYFRGWEAWVDGRRVPVERVNFTLRGVELSPGSHKVEFVFRAPSFRSGAILSAVGMLLLIAGGIISHRKRS
ncbi:MAG: YfhO family protein [Acidobacteriota bacterium]|nr:YfhO family protein [Acidobacteriota bacterium]